jgi:hypothetical protein
MLRPDSARPEDASQDIADRLRRRMGRLGVTIAVFATLTVSLVVFAICACRSTR